MPWFEEDNFLDKIISNVNIIDVLSALGLDYSVCDTGDFTHRLKCPLPVHRFGNERTASLFVSEKSNSFYCFGCNSGGRVIEFVSLYMGKPYHESLKWLSDLSKNYNKIHGCSKLNVDLGNKTVSEYVYKTGSIIREFVNKQKGKKGYNKWCRWADNKFVKLDRFMDTLNDEDFEVVRFYYKNTLKYLKSRQ